MYASSGTEQVPLEACRRYASSGTEQVPLEACPLCASSGTKEVRLKGDRRTLMSLILFIVFCLGSNMKQKTKPGGALQPSSDFLAAVSGA